MAATDTHIHEAIEAVWRIESPRLIAGLAEPFRETFVLREIENLSYREIADVAEVPVGTVMSRLARARAMLRSAWLAEQEPKK